MWRTAQLIALIKKESIYLQGQLQTLTQYWKWETAFILLCAHQECVTPVGWQVSVTEVFVAARAKWDPDLFAKMDLSTSTSSCGSRQICCWVNVHRLSCYHLLNWLCLGTEFTATESDLFWCHFSTPRAVVPRLTHQRQVCHSFVQSLS